MNSRDLFCGASPEALSRGYTAQGQDYICLICEKSFTQGIIYQDEERLLEAKLAIETHIAREHGSMFDYLLNLDKKLTGLSDVQQQLLASFQAGESDKEIAARQGISASTVRNHRFKLRERERQARVFLALMKLLNVKDDFIPIHKGATAVDERYAVTLDEEKKILNNYLRDGKLVAFPAREKRKLIILRHFAGLFDPERVYTEKEVNAVIRDLYDDYVTIRRYLIEYGFMERSRDGSEYQSKQLKSR